MRSKQFRPLSFFKMLSLASLCLATNTCIAAPSQMYNAIEQGNVLDLPILAQLKLGISKDAVINLLGYPLIPNDMLPDRLHYCHFYAKGEFIEDLQRLSLRFENDKLVEITMSSALASSISSTVAEDGISKDMARAIEATKAAML